MRQQIPLKDLRVSDHNARKTGAEAGLVELAASIQANGLFHPLIVRSQPCAPAKRGKKKPPPSSGYETGAGGRRLRAMLMLVEKQAEGWTLDTEVECEVVDASDAKFLELSLAENVTQLPMQPVEQYEAFVALKAPPSEIAVRFGITERMVLQRMALAKLVPDVLQLLRDGEISLGVAQVLTMATAKWQQNEFLAAHKSRCYWANQADQLRSVVLLQGIPREYAIFNHEFYKGTAIVDLFAVEADTGYFADAKQFFKLQQQAVKERAAALKADGWRAVHIVEHYEDWRMSGPGPASFDLTEEGKALEAELDKLVLLEAANNDALEAYYDEETAETKKAKQAQEKRGQDLREEGERIEARIAEIERVLDPMKEGKGVYSDEQRAAFDCYIHAKKTGEVQFHYGVITSKEMDDRRRAEAQAEREREAQERAAAAPNDEETTADDDDGDEETGGPGELPAPAEVEDLKTDFNQLHYSQSNELSGTLSAAMANRLAVDVRKALEILIVMLAGKRNGISSFSTPVHLDPAPDRGGATAARATATIEQSFALAGLGNPRAQSRMAHDGNAIELYDKLTTLGDSQLLEIVAGYVAIAFNTHNFDAFFRTIALDLGMSVRELWSPSKPFLAHYTKAQLAALATHLQPGEPLKPGNFAKDDLIETVMKRMTLCWKPEFASFATVLRAERQPNGVNGEEALEPMKIPVVADGDEPLPIAAE